MSRPWPGGGRGARVGPLRVPISLSWVLWGPACGRQPLSRLGLGTWGSRMESAA